MIEERGWRIREHLVTVCAFILMLLYGNSDSGSDYSLQCCISHQIYVNLKILYNKMLDVLYKSGFCVFLLEMKSEYISWECWCYGDKI